MGHAADRRHAAADPLETAAAYTTTDFRADLAAVKVPTLVVHGDLDASAPIDLTGRRTAALIAGSRLLVYEGSGHGLYAADRAPQPRRAGVHRRAAGDRCLRRSRATQVDNL
jgi:pimeloyl-ACP methyl ester carboxylesterase